MKHGLGLMVAVLAAGTGLAGEPMALTLADRLLAENGKTRSMRCEVRRELEAEGGTLLSLSRVWFERPDKLRVQTVAPEARRIVADGTAIYKWLEGQTVGVRIPIADAPEGELVQLRKTPGTAEEHLARIRALPETVLSPTDDFPVRRGYAAPPPHPFTVLSLDATGRLARLEFFDSASCTNRLLAVFYSGWKEAKPGIWVSCLQKTQARGRDGTDVSETLRVGGLEVNDPIDPAEFDIAKQAVGVTFLSPNEAAERLKK